MHQVNNKSALAKHGNRSKMKTHINVTIPTKKGKKTIHQVFTIEFLIKNFDVVVDKVSTITSYEDLKNCLLWTVK